MHSPSHIYIRKSIENTEKNPYLFSFFIILYIFILLFDATLPRAGALYVIKEEDSLLFFRAYFFHSKRTLKRPVFFNCSFSAIHHFPSLFFVTFWLFRNTSLGKEKTNKNHAASLFQRGYDSRRERESEAGERGAIKREANGTLSFDFFFSLNSLFITFC